VSWALTILGIMLLIVLHELGHFAMAKAVGMRVERFSLFFPPTIARVKWGETEYALGALPLGGYVKITGMNPEELDDMDPELTRRAYYSQAPWRRIAVILAGPAVNILITVLLFWLVLFSGNLDGASALDSLDGSSPQTLVSSTSVQEIKAGEPAYGVLRAGDRIIAVEGRAATVSSTQAAISAHRCAGKLINGCQASTPVALTVRRDGRALNLSIRPRYDASLRRMLIGFDFGAVAKRFGAVAAAGATVAAMWSVTTSTLTNIGHAFTSAKVRGELHSIVGITEVAHESVAAGLGFALIFLGFVSLVLAVINLFPFLPLDGGHVLWSALEKLRGRRISLAAMYRYSSVGIVLLLFLVVNGVSNDIGRLGG